MRVIGTFWGPWDLGMPNTYFKSMITPKQYMLAMRSYLGSPVVKDFPLIKAIGKMHRSLEGKTMAGKHTSKYVCQYSDLLVKLGNPIWHRSSTNFAWGIPDDFAPSIPYFELDIPIPDDKTALTVNTVTKFVEKMVLSEENR